jgi:hypothetical protein
MTYILKRTHLYFVLIFARLHRGFFPKHRLGKKVGTYMAETLQEDVVEANEEKPGKK